MRPRPRRHPPSHRSPVAGQRLGRRLAAVAAGACVLAGCTAQGPAAAARAGGTAHWRVAYQAGTNGVQSVTATAAGDAWAVGSAGSGPLVLHWDGRAWQAFPGPGVPDLALVQVAASSPRDVWVLGEDTGGSDPVRSIYRWDGSGWRQMAGLPEFSYIAQMLVLGPDDVWVTTGSGGAGDELYHFNGTGWTGYPDQLAGVSVLAGTAPADVWAAGWVYGGPAGRTQVAAAERWDGSRWTRVTLPRLASAVSGIGMSSAADVWLGGAGFLLHWNGHSWRTLTAPPGDGGDSTQVVPDGHGGAWLGADTHWTGLVWVHENPPDGYSIDGGLARVPGTSSYWAVGYGYVGTIGGSPMGGAVLAFGPLPF